MPVYLVKLRQTAVEEATVLIEASSEDAAEKAARALDEQAATGENQPDISYETDDVLDGPWIEAKLVDRQDIEPDYVATPEDEEYDGL